jgi:hypothetical protein
VILVVVGRGTRRRLGLAADAVPGHPDVRVLDPSGLSVPGWAHDPEAPADGRMVIAGEIHPPGRLTAVITALDAVEPFDLPHVQTEDRGFVAAEMTAFLRDWLQTLPCPVLDRPTALALSGPGGDAAVWSEAAASLGIPDLRQGPVRRLRSRVVTVVAGQAIGPAAEPAAAAAVALTEAAGVTAAMLRFSDDAPGPALRDAVPWWHTPSRLVLRAVLATVPSRLDCCTQSSEVSSAGDHR